MTLTARNLAGLRWIENGKVATFLSGRAYGVVDGDGRMLSTDGVTPSTWGTLAVARTIAEFPPSNARWIAAL